MPYFKGEKRWQVQKIDEMVKSMVAAGMDKERAYPIAIARVQKMKKRKKQVKMSDKLIVFSDGGDVIELADKKYRKQVLRKGVWEYGNDIFSVTADKINELVSNFKSVWRNVPITKGHQDNQTLEEHPELILGYIEDMIPTENGLDVIFSIKDETLVGEKYRDVSAGIRESYRNHENGKEQGSVMTHVAMVVEPYIKGLKPFVQLADGAKLDVLNASLVNLEEQKMDENKEQSVPPVVEEQKSAEAPKVEETAKVDEVQKQDAPESEQKEEKKDETVTDNVTAKVAEETAKEEPKKADETAPVGASEAVVVGEDRMLSEALEREKNLAEENRKLKAEAIFDKYLSEGKVVPAQKDAVMAFLKAGSLTINLGEESQSVSALFEEFIKKTPKIVDFSEAGITVSGNATTDPLSELTEEDKNGFKQLFKGDWEKKAYEFLAMKKKQS